MLNTQSATIYSLAEPMHGGRFTSVLSVGSRKFGHECSVCGFRESERVYPLRIRWTVEEWGPGSDVIPDFNWPRAHQILLVSQLVRDYLQERVTGIRFGAVEMVDDPTLHRPKRITKRTKKRVWLPYEGPPLHEIIVDKVVHLDIERSGRTFTLCPGCGRKQFKVRHDAQDIVPRSEWTGEDFFRIDENGGADGPVFVTQHARDLLKAGRFTNLSIRRCGAIVP